MKRIVLIFSVVSAGMLFFACGGKGNEMKNTYIRITASEAKQIMDEKSGYIILDVRRQDEYETGHIPGAALLPNEEIGKGAIEMLPDKDQIILVYCRSGNRSRQAAQKLAELGYTNVYEFGGIIDWPYEIE